MGEGFEYFLLGAGMNKCRTCPTPSCARSASVHRLDSTLLISGDDSTDSAYWGSSGSSISQMSDSVGGSKT